MTYESFEDVPVWRDAIRLAELVDDLLIEIPVKQISYAKRDQIDRASLSVSNNIAEGFDRGSNKELVHLLYVARGSASETCSMSLFFKRRPYLKEYHSRFSEVEKLARSCAKQLMAWTKHLQTSAVKGSKYTKSS